MNIRIVYHIHTLLSEYIYIYNIYLMIPLMVHLSSSSFDHDTSLTPNLVYQSSFQLILLCYQSRDIHYRETEGESIKYTHIYIHNILQLMTHTLNTLCEVRRRWFLSVTSYYSIHDWSVKEYSGKSCLSHLSLCRTVKQLVSNV